MFEQSPNHSPCNSTLTELGIRQSKHMRGSNTSPGQDSLEHLVLQSGDKALQNMVHVFRRQLNEDDLQLLSGSRKMVLQNEYREYEQNVRTLLAPHWQGPARGLKKHVRRSLKPFRKSSGLLNRLLSTPARITATACMTVLLGGYNSDASVPLNAVNAQQLMSPPAVKQESPRREIIFADASLPDLEILLIGAPAAASVVILQPSGNLIGQMIDHLLQAGPVDSLHLFTHGAPGQLQFGDAVINQVTLKRQAKQLSLLGTLLTGSRDIFLYGCQVAAGRQGNDFINQLSTLTGADVAASDDFTGAAAKGGDWELELVAGKVNNRAIASLDYSALLASGHVIAGDGSGGGGGGESGGGGEYGDGEIGGAGYYQGASGGAGGGDNDTITGTGDDDIMFGDGSGGGGGGGDSYYGYEGPGGNGGSGDDTISGGGGNDILFGDGFNGSDGSYSGGDGGFGGGGGGGGSFNSYWAGELGVTFSGAAGGIGGGGGGGADYADGGAGGHGGGGGGGGGAFWFGDPGGSGGSGGGFNATDGVTPSNDEGGGGGGGAYAGGTGGTGGSLAGITPGDGGDGGNGTYTAGGGNGGAGGADYGGGGGGGGFGGGSGGSGGYLSAGSPGTAGGTDPVTLIDSPTLTIYNSVKGAIGTLAALPGGAGNDTLDGGPGSDDLFGMGGTNTFVFQSCDATTGSDIDTIYDFNNGTANKIDLKTGGVTLNNAEVSAIVGVQTTAGGDRTIVHRSGSNQVTIVVKSIGRDLTTSDFNIGAGGGACTIIKKFPWILFRAAMTPPPCPDEPQYCYLVSDRDNEASTFLDEGSSNSALLKYTFENNELELIGRLGVGQVEAITFSLDGTVLYAVDSGVFGVIDTTPGNTSSFKPVNSAGLGTGYGAMGWIRFTDIDGLTFDPSIGILYGVQRLPDAPDVLLQIDPATGTFVENAFGVNIDYVVIGDNLGDAAMYDLDDIAIDENGTMHGIVNVQGNNDKFVVIDKKTGVVTDPLVVDINGVPLNDIEGLTYYNKDVFFGTTGVETVAQDGEYQNSLFKIELNPMKSEKIISLDKDFNGYVPYDFESVACPVCRPNERK